MYNLIETRNGKETVVMTDSFKNVTKRMKTLKDSHRKTKVSYKIVETTDNVKYRRKPAHHCIYNA